MTAVLAARELGKRYGSRWALRDCTLQVPAGAVVALVGPNGAGKSTLLQLAVGLLDPSQGSVSVLGEAPRERSEVLARVGFVAQDAPLYPSFRVGEMLEFGRRLNRGWDDAWSRERLRELRIPLHQRVGSLSGGERAQVSLTMALAKRPELLLLDEPVASLDPLARRMFLQTLMRAVAENAVSVVLSSHLVADLERVCDFLVLLLASEVRLAGPIDDLLIEHKLLTGPARRDGRMAGVAEVVRADHSPRQSTLVARLDGHVADPAWSVDDIGFEELLLAYMGSGPDLPPDAATPARTVELHAI